MASEFIARTYKTDHSSPLRFIWSHIIRHPLFGFLMLSGAFSNAALASAVPYFIGRAFNAVIDQQDALSTVINMSLAIIAAQLIRAGLQVIRNFSAEIFAQRIERDVRDELYASLLGKSMTFHASQPVGEIMARVTNDVREMNLMMNPGMNLVIGSGFFLLLPLLASPLIHPALALVPAIFLVIYFWLQYRFIRSLNPIAQEVRTSFGQMNARLAETIEGVQVVKGAAREASEIKVFDALADKVKDYFVRQGYIEARYLPFLLLAIINVVAFVHALILHRLGLITSGDIVAFMGMIFLFQFPTFSSMRSLSQIALGYAGAGRILSIINMQTDLDQNQSGYDKPLHGAIAFENVSFGYGEAESVVRDISFTIKPGQTVAIVGQTGVGKTTLTRLINRTWDVGSGRVLVDGIDVREWSLASLRSQISIIEQDIFLFSRSIADNIRFGRQDATQAEVEEAARRAQAHEFIVDMPEGYDTVVGQRGVTLSGGQRQRIAIARAFLTDPPVLILDDSTSAIDSATEDRIQKAIWAASRGRTTIIITHRLSQIRWADHIIVLRQGQVVAQGSHDELLRDSVDYRRIFARYEHPESGRLLATGD